MSTNAKQIFAQYHELLNPHYERCEERGEEYIPITFNKPATREEIKQVEEKLDVQLPLDVVDFYLEHNGGADNLTVLYAEEWTSLEDNLDEWDLWLENLDDMDHSPVQNDKGVKKVFWSKKWLPFTRDGGGNCYCIDMDPDIENGGKYGQIIRFWHDSFERTIEASSFTEFFLKFFEAFKSKRYGYDSEFGICEEFGGDASEFGSLFGESGIYEGDLDFLNFNFGEGEEGDSDGGLEFDFSTCTGTTPGQDK